MSILSIFNLFQNSTCSKFLLDSRKFPPNFPLFVKLDGSIAIDTYFRDALRLILTRMGISHAPHGFHTFRRSGATLAFDNSVPLQNIMAHGLWRSDAI